MPDWLFWLWITVILVSFGSQLLKEILVPPSFDPKKGHTQRRGGGQWSFAKVGMFALLFGGAVYSADKSCPAAYTRGFKSAPTDTLVCGASLSSALVLGIYGFVDGVVNGG